MRFPARTGSSNRLPGLEPLPRITLCQSELLSKDRAPLHTRAIDPIRARLELLSGFVLHCRRGIGRQATETEAIPGRQSELVGPVIAVASVFRIVTAGFTIAELSPNTPCWCCL